MWMARCWRFRWRRRGTVLDPTGWPADCVPRRPLLYGITLLPAVWTLADHRGGWAAVGMGALKIEQGRRPSGTRRSARAQIEGTLPGSLRVSALVAARRRRPCLRALPTKRPRPQSQHQQQDLDHQEERANPATGSKAHRTSGRRAARNRGRAGGARQQIERRAPTGAWGLTRLNST